MKTRDRWTAVVAALGALALLVPLPAPAQESGAEVYSAVMDRAEARLEGVDSVTVVQETTTSMGTSTTQELHLVKETRNGRTILLPKGGESGQQVMPPASILATGDSLMERSRLRGRSRVDGREVYVVAAPDLSGMDFGQGALSGTDARSFEADSATFYVDTESYVLRRADVHGRMNMGGRERAVSLGVHLRDYRETAGYLHPFRSEIQVEIEGLGEQMQAMMEKMQQAGADSARRAMMEQAMGAMLGGGVTVTSTVTELRVNGRSNPGGS